MMDKIDELLNYIRKSNPEMTRDTLIRELNVSRYSTAGLVFTFENFAKRKIENRKAAY